MKIINILFLWLLIQHLLAVSCHNLQAKPTFIIRKASNTTTLAINLFALKNNSFLPCRWYCEGKELENSPDIQIIQTGDRHSLVIVEAFEEDTGRYSCFASNIYGTDSTSAEIYIEGNVTRDAETDGQSGHTGLRHSYLSGLLTMVCLSFKKKKSIAGVNTFHHYKYHYYFPVKCSSDKGPALTFYCVASQRFSTPHCKI